MKQSFGEDTEEEHVLIIFETDDHRWLAADPTAPADVGVGFRASAAKEEVIDPLDPQGTGTQASEFVSVGKRPHFELKLDASLVKVVSPMAYRKPPRQVLLGDVSPPQDYIKDLQDAVGNQLIRIMVIVEDCPTLDTATKSAWDVTAQRAIAFTSHDPSTASADEGKAILAAFDDFSTTLVTKGCATSGEVPPVTAPIAPPPGTDWEGLAKLGLWTLMFGVGAYGLSEIVKLVELGTLVLPKHHEAAAEAKRLMRRTG
jgi:hypothetical protein